MRAKQILLVLDAGGPATSACAMAASLAEREGGRVTGWCLFHEPEIAIADSFAVGPSAVGEVIQQRADDIRWTTRGAKSAFDVAVAGHGLSDGWRLCEIDDWRDGLAAELLLADVVVVAGGGESRAFRNVVERLVVESSAPCLIAPAKAAPDIDFRRIVLGWNASRAAARALRDATPFLVRAPNVFVVVGSERPEVGAEASVERLLRRLACHGVRAELVRGDVAGSAGAWLLGQCAALQADLLVMGAYGHSRAAEAIMGGATRSVLARAELPVFMSH